MKFLNTTLDNGLTILGEQNPAARSMATGYFTRTGARDETAPIAGVSHFLEHMLFKGTAHRSAEDVNREFDEIGAQYNAFTSEENTVYYGAVLPEFQGRVLDLLTDMMRPALREADFSVEKKVILEEIALYRDRPQFTVMDEARATYFGEHPLGHSVLGTPETIGALTHLQMRDYWQRRYAANNLILVLAGNFDWEAALRQVTQATRHWDAAETPRSLAEPEIAPRVRVISNEKFNRAHLALVAPGVPAQSPERYAASIIGDIVGASEGSRLYWDLVEPGLVDTARMYHDEMDGAGAFFTYISCDPERAQEILDRARVTFRKAREQGVTDDEVARTKRKFASALVLGSETPFGRLLHVGFDWQYRREFVSVDETIEAVLAVSPEQVQRLLQELPIDQPTIVALGPLGDLS
jgi:predicted Zn-dependent peptidase